MFQTPSNGHSSDFGHWSRDEPSSKRHCPDSTTAPELHKRFLDFTSSTYMGNQRTYYSSASVSAEFGSNRRSAYSSESRTFYKKNSTYYQENLSMRGQQILEYNTTANRWDFRYCQPTQPAGEYSGYSTTHPSYQLCYRAGCGHYKEPFVLADDWATRIGDNISSTGLSVHDSNRNSVYQFPSSEAKNPSMNLGYSKETRDFDNNSVYERPDLYRPKFTSKPPRPGGSYEQGYLSNHANMDVDFPRESSENPNVTDMRVYHTVADFPSKSGCESAATGACGEATAHSHSSGPMIGQDGGSHAVHATKCNTYTSTSILPSGRNVSAVLGGMGCNEKKAYSDDCLTSVTNIPIVHPQGQSNAAPCMPQMTSATFQGKNTVAPASGIKMYPEFKPNFCLLNTQAINHVTSDGFSRSTSSQPNFISSVGLIANTWSVNANTASHSAYTQEELACSESNDSVATAADSDVVTSSFNMTGPLISKESSMVKVNDGNGSRIPNMSESGVGGEPTTAGASVDGSVFVMHKNSAVVGQADALRVNAESSSSIANNDEIAAESGRADEHIESKVQIGPQAYPSSYEGILKSVISHAKDSASRPKSKLKWPLAIPLFVKPHETPLTFNDIDYSWVTHDIQVTVQGGLYAHTIDPKGLLQVFVNSPRAANSLLNLSSLAGLPVKISVGHNYTDKIGYIRGVPR